MPLSFKVLNLDTAVTVPLLSVAALMLEVENPQDLDRIHYWSRKERKQKQKPLPQAFLIQETCTI